MKNWDSLDEIGQCNGEKDFTDAQWICDRLKVPLLHVNFVKEYWNDVFGYGEIARRSFPQIQSYIFYT